MTSFLAAAAAWLTLQAEIDPIPYSLPELEALLLRLTGFLIGFAVVLLVGWVVVEPTISRIVRRRNQNNPTLEEAVTRYVRLSFLILGLFVGISAAGFAIVVGNSALVLAAGTVALGIAGQNVIGSLVSGTALVVDPAFNVGNYIRWEDGEGEVTSITLRVTRVRTPDGGLVTIPNTTLTDGPISRPFEGGTCRTVERVTVAYDDDVETALYLLTGVVDDVDGIVEDPDPKVGIAELGDDAVVLHVEYWIDDPERNQLHVRSDFARTVKSRLEGADIDISPASRRDLEGQIQVGDAV